MVKKLRLPEYNYDFNTETGLFVRWGKTREDDPQLSPIGPEIADIEITTSCHGAGGELCKFCSPAGTMIQTVIGDIPIEQIKKGDIVLGYNNNKNNIQLQTVEAVYERDYEGEVIEITHNNKKLVLTPEHLIYTKNRGWIEAQQLNEQDILVILENINTNIV